MGRVTQIIVLSL